MRKDKSEIQKNLFQILNLALTCMLIVINLTNSSESKLIFLSGEESNNENILLKKKICSTAFNGLKVGDINSDLIHPEIIDYMKSSISDVFKAEDIKDVFVEMTSKDECRVIFKKENGFAGLNAIITRNGPLGFRVTTLNIIKLKVNDVRSYL